MSVSWFSYWDESKDKPDHVAIKQGNTHYALVPSLEWLDFHRTAVELPSPPKEGHAPDDPIYTHLNMKYMFIRHHDATVPYTDIEYTEWTNQPDVAKFELNLATINARIVAELCSMLPEGTPTNPQLVISSANRWVKPGEQFKYSYHVMYRGVGHFTCYEARCVFKDRLKSLIKDDISMWIEDTHDSPVDLGVYGRSQAFRMVGMVKHDYKKDYSTGTILVNRADADAMLVPVNEHDNWLAHCPTWIGESDTTAFVIEGLDQIAARGRRRVGHVSTNCQHKPINADDVMLAAQVGDSKANEVYSGLFGQRMVVSYIGQFTSNEVVREKWRLTPTRQLEDLIGCIVEKIPDDRVQKHEWYIKLLYIICNEMHGFLSQQEMFDRYIKGFMARVRPGLTETAHWVKWTEVYGSVTRAATVSDRRALLGSLAHEEWCGLEWFRERVAECTGESTHRCPIHNSDEHYCRAGVEDVLESGVMERYICCYDGEQVKRCYLGPADHFEYTRGLYSTNYMSDVLDFTRLYRGYFASAGTVDRAYAQSLNPPAIPGEQETWVNIGPMGSGKTRVMESMLKKIPTHRSDGREIRMICICNRVTLCDAMEERCQKFVRTVHYRKRTSEDFTGGLLITTLDSLVAQATMSNNRVEPFDVVIAEEQNALQGHTGSDTLKNKTTPTVLVLEHIYRTAGVVAVFDADVGYEVMEFLHRVRGDSNIRVYRNIYSRLQREYIIHRNKMTWQSRLLRYVGEGQKVYVACNNRLYAESIAHLLQQRSGERQLKIKLYTSQTSHAERSDIRHCNELWKDLDVVIATSVIETGVDCSERIFDRVMIFHGRFSTMSRQSVQSGLRVRDPANTSVEVYVDEQPMEPGQQVFRLPESPDAVKQYLIDNCHLVFPELVAPRLTRAGEWIAADPDGVGLFFATCINREKRIESNRPVHYFCRCVVKSGGRYSIERDQEGDMSLYRIDVSDMTDHVHRVIVQRAVSVASASLLSSEELRIVAAKLSDTNAEVTVEEKDSFVKTQTLNRLGVPDELRASFQDPVYYMRYSDNGAFLSWLHVIGYTGLERYESADVERVQRIICDHFYLDEQSKWFTSFKLERCKLAMELLALADIDAEHLKTGKIFRTQELRDQVHPRLHAWLSNDSNYATLQVQLRPLIDSTTKRIRYNSGRQRAGDTVKFYSSLLEKVLGLYIIPTENHNRYYINPLCIASHVNMLYVIDEVFAFNSGLRPTCGLYEGMQFANQVPFPRDCTRNMLLPRAMFIKLKNRSEK